MSKAKTRLVVLAAVLLLLVPILPILTGCASPRGEAPFPFVTPPEGVDYIEVDPYDLGTAYLTRYGGGVGVADNLYKGKSFIFKDILVTEQMLEYSDGSSIYIYYTHCIAQNPSDIQKLHVGDRIDVLGYNAGWSYEHMQIEFTGCQFFPAGVVPIPLPGSPGPIVIGY